MVSFQQTNYLLFTSEIYEELPKQNGEIRKQQLVRKDNFLVCSDGLDLNSFEYAYHLFEGKSGPYDFIITPTSKVSGQFYNTHTELWLENVVSGIFN